MPRKHTFTIAITVAYSLCCLLLCACAFCSLHCGYNMYKWCSVLFCGDGVMVWRPLFLIQHRCRCAKWILYGQRWSGTTIGVGDVKRVVSLAKIVFEYTHLHCWNSCKWKITRYKIQNWYRYLNMNREWTDMNSNTIFYCALCHQADDPFFDVSACANSMCQWEFVVAENYRCRTYTWNMFAFVVHCILYIITALCTLCGMSMFFLLLHLFSVLLQIFDGNDSFVCVRMWMQNCVRTWYFACSSLRSVSISLNLGDCTRNCCNYHLWRRFFVVAVTICCWLQLTPTSWDYDNPHSNARVLSESVRKNLIKRIGELSKIISKWLI